MQARDAVGVTQQTLAAHRRQHLQPTWTNIAWQQLANEIALTGWSMRHSPHSTAVRASRDFLVDAMARNSHMFWAVDTAKMKSLMKPEPCGLINSGSL